MKTRELMDWIFSIYRWRTDNSNEIEQLEITEQTKQDPVTMISQQITLAPIDRYSYYRILGSYLEVLQWHFVESLNQLDEGRVTQLRDSRFQFIL